MLDESLVGKEGIDKVAEGEGSIGTGGATGVFSTMGVALGMVGMGVPKFKPKLPMSFDWSESKVT